MRLFSISHSRLEVPMDAVIIALASGKGGTGNTSAAVFIGGALAGLGRQVALIELSGALRSVDLMAGVSGQTVFDVADVLSGRSAPGKALAQSPHTPGLHVMSAPYAGGPLPFERLRQLCTRLRPHFDYILLDVQSGTGPAFEAAREVCHRMVLVAAPEPVALRSARMLAEAMEGRDAPLRLLLSRVIPELVLQEGCLADLDEAIDTVGAQLLGVVPESGRIHQSVARGEALPQNTTEEKIFTAIARRITGEDVPLVIG